MVSVFFVEVSNVSPFVHEQDMADSGAPRGRMQIVERIFREGGPFYSCRCGVALPCGEDHQEGEPGCLHIAWLQERYPVGLDIPHVDGTGVCKKILGADPSSTGPFQSIFAVHSPYHGGWQIVKCKSFHRVSLRLANC